MLLSVCLVCRQEKKCSATFPLAECMLACLPVFAQWDKTCFITSRGSVASGGDIISYEIEHPNQFYVDITPLNIDTRQI